LQDVAAPFSLYLAVGPYRPFATWSPDGRTIAVSALFLGRHSRWVLNHVSVEKGRVTELYSSDYKIGRPLWLPDGSGLLLMLDDPTSQGQLWVIPFPRREPRRFTHDLADYGDDFITMTRDGKTLAVIQYNETGHVWRAPAADLSRAEQLESGALALVNVAPGPWVSSWQGV